MCAIPLRFEPQDTSRQADGWVSIKQGAGLDRPTPASVPSNLLKTPVGKTGMGHAHSVHPDVF